MKIAILSFYCGYLERGAENWTLQFASRLSKSHEVCVFQNGPSGVSKEYKVVSTNISINWKKKDSPGILTRRLFIDYKSRLIALFSLKVIPVLFKGKYDLLIPINGGWQPAFMRLLTWLQRKKMIIVGHAGIGWDDANNLWTFPDCFVALSTQVKNWAKKINPFVKTVYIPNGVDSDKFKPQGVKKVIKLAKPIILCVSALEKTKRVDLIIKAVSKLKKASLLVVGDGIEREKLDNLGKKVLGKRFLLRKFKFDEMPSVYRSVDVFTSASRPEYSFEMVLLEAMATNLPVVANNDPIRAQIVRDAGILTDPTDVERCSEAVQKALCTDWNVRPRKQAEKFSLDKIVEKYDALFKEL